MLLVEADREGNLQRNLGYRTTKAQRRRHRLYKGHPGAGVPLTRCHLPAKHPTAARQQSQPTTAATVAQRNRCLLSIFYGNPMSATQNRRDRTTWLVTVRER